MASGGEGVRTASQKKWPNGVRLRERWLGSAAGDRRGNGHSGYFSRLKNRKTGGQVDPGCIPVIAGNTSVSAGTKTTRRVSYPCGRAERPLFWGARAITGMHPLTRTRMWVMFELGPR
jgi:hypothetical protein